MSAAALVQMLVEFAKDCETEYNEDLDLNPDSLAILMTAVRDCRAELDVLRKRIEQDLIHTAGEKRFTVEGLGEVEIKGSMKRTQWDSEALVRKIVALAADERILNEATGEYERESEAVARKLSEAARFEWRTTPLKAWHIPVDEYCTETFNGYSVRLQPRGA